METISKKVMKLLFGAVKFTNTRSTDTDAIGVLIIHIHRASGIKKMDTAELSGTPAHSATYLSKPLVAIVFHDHP